MSLREIFLLAAPSVYSNCRERAGNHVRAHTHTLVERARASEQERKTEIYSVNVVNIAHAWPAALQCLGLALTLSHRAVDPRVMNLRARLGSSSCR